MSNSTFDVYIDSISTDYTDRYYTPWFPIGFNESSHIVTYERYVEDM